MSDAKWTAYYAEKGDELNTKRRERYAEDPEYKQRILDANAVYRAKRKEEKVREKARKKKSVRMERTEGHWKTVQMEVDGVVQPMFTIGALARALGKGISTCRVWERDGVLPETPHRSPKGDRLYTAKDVSKIRRRLQRSGKLPLAGTRMNEKKKPDYVDRAVRFRGGESRIIRLYKIGTLATMIDRTVVSLTQMEKMGRLPVTPLRASKLRYRLYTLRMLEGVRDAFKRQGCSIRGEAQWQEFYDEVHADWESLGVFGARVLEKDNGNQSKTDQRRRATGGAVLREAASTHA